MLLDDLRELGRKAESVGCVVGVWVQEQEAEFQTVMNDLRLKPQLNMSQTLDLIKDHYGDLPFKRTSFVMHMRRNCTCPTA